MESIVGTLIDVGLGKIQEQDLVNIINQKDKYFFVFCIRKFILSLILSM